MAHHVEDIRSIALVGHEVTGKNMVICRITPKLDRIEPDKGDDSHRDGPKPGAAKSSAHKTAKLADQATKKGLEGDLHDRDKISDS